jgi:hypothetical protein
MPLLSCLRHGASDGVMKLSWSSAVALGAAVLVAATFGWFSHPVCQALTEEQVAEANKWGRLEDRMDRQLHGRVWQKRDGQWYHCKSWISRQLFF